VNFELAHDVGTVTLNRLSAQAEDLGDTLVRVALDNQLEDPAFPGRQRLDVVASLHAAHVVDELGGGRRVEE
jgi:hypothetical protein